MSEINLKQEVGQLLAEIDKTHRYSMSRIYNLANNVFGESESPQSCASCLIRKVRELRSWLAKQENVVETEKVPQKKKRKKKEGNI
ncbi:hypothetical protein GGR21_002961 [Dysgonomonas hofstadii]|uniref:Uncharacterized protein n=1 Tax=Dysgonomonas hofstadii TaxID=637886 RepID=A0A840CLW5_9BACT|nr:hypothetical protein [Dysgonomonas hofstadii]MBB4037047.1 hypothetical protein [Dysgonomonas hofstadii]